MADEMTDPQTGSMEGPGGTFTIECLPVVLGQIRAEVTDAFYSAPRGGVEVGGVLYGARQDARIVILAARPLSCEHASGPSFVLSESDHARLTALLEAPQHDRNLAGMRVLGWYHSHTRSELELTPQDLEIHDRYFPHPGQVALVLRPGATGPMRTCFYVRETGGSVVSLQRPVESATAQVMAAARPEEAPREPPSESVSSAVTGSSGQAVVVAPALDPPRKDVKAPLYPPRSTVVKAPQPRRPQRGVWASVVVVACLLAGAAGYLISDYRSRTRAPELPSGLRLQVTDQQGQLEVRWDATLQAVQNARGGSLEFVDGSTRRVVPLDPKLLRSGSVNYARLSDTLRIRMIVEMPDGSRLEEPIIFVGQAPSGSPAEPQPDLVRQQAAEAAAEAVRWRAELERKRLAAKNQIQPPLRPADAEKPPAPPTVAPTAKVKQPAIEPSKPTPVVSQPEPQSVPPPQIAAPPAAQTKEPLLAAKGEPAVVNPPVAAAKPPTVGLAPLSGEWTLARSVPSGSPFRPDSVTLSLTEEGNRLRGMLVGRYRTSKASGIKPEVSFVFGGPVRAGVVKLPWVAPDGANGEIEFIRIPNNTESLEVVWYFADRKFVFDDVLVRTKKQ